MTLRSGGRPRDARQAHPIAEEAREEAWEPEYRRPPGNGHGSNGGGYGRRGAAAAVAGTVACSGSCCSP